MIKVIGAGLAIATAIGLFVAIINTFDNKKNTILGVTICCISVFILLCIALSYVL